MASGQGIHGFESNAVQPDVEDIIWRGYRQGWPVDEVLTRLHAAGAREVTADEVRRRFRGLSEFVGQVVEALAKGEQDEGAGR
jgi:hypothetical protein